MFVREEYESKKTNINWFVVQVYAKQMFIREYTTATLVSYVFWKGEGQNLALILNLPKKKLKSSNVGLDEIFKHRSTVKTPL